MAISTGSFLKDLMPFIGKWFGDEYKEYAPEYSRVFKMGKAEGKFVDEPLISGLGLAKIKAEGDDIDYDEGKQGYTSRYEMVTYGLGTTITREAIEDAQTLSHIERSTRQLKRALMHAMEQEAALILDRAFNTSYLGADGDTLCSTSHSTVGGDRANRPTADADMSEAALEQAMIDIQDYRDDRGLRINVEPTKLVIPPSLQFDVARVLKGDFRVGTADNDINAMKYLGMLQAMPVVMRRLTDTDAWFVLTDAPDGLKGFIRREPEVGQDNEFQTENARIKATCRFDFGWTDWRGIYGSQGA